MPRRGVVSASAGLAPHSSKSASCGERDKGLSMLAVGESAIGEGSSWRREARVSSEGFEWSDLAESIGGG